MRKQIELLQALLDQRSVPVQTTVTTSRPRVLDEAIAYLQDHPDVLDYSGRKLAKEVQINGKLISYKTWLTAKSLIK